MHTLFLFLPPLFAELRAKRQAHHTKKHHCHSSDWQFRNRVGGETFAIKFCVVGLQLRPPIQVRTGQSCHCMSQITSKIRWKRFFYNAVVWVCRITVMFHVGLLVLATFASVITVRGTHVAVRKVMLWRDASSEKCNSNHITVLFLK